jgi:putative phosphonate transport system ATP-binding protein
MTTTEGPILVARNLTRVFGDGCKECIERTGPATGDNVCPRCGSVVACHGVDMDLYPDEVLGIVGESGSGKSTVVRLLHFDLEATDGTLQLTLNGRGDRLRQALARNRGSIRAEENGESDLLRRIEGADLFGLSSFGRRQLRNFAMGVVYQSPPLGLRMEVSAGGNIAEKLLMAGDRHVQRMRDRAAGLLDRTEVPAGRMDEPPRNFSGGMQQRVQIAKAISNEPMLLFLDEVTTGLDVSVQARVLDLLRELQRDLHIATIVVSHDLAVIRMLTTRTMVMKNGRVVEAGLTDQILEDPQHPYTQLLVSSIL